MLQFCFNIRTNLLAVVWSFAVTLINITLRDQTFAGNTDMNTYFVGSLDGFRVVYNEGGLSMWKIRLIFAQNRRTCQTFRPR